jgi:hypothetical protein
MKIKESQTSPYTNLDRDVNKLIEKESRNL